MNETNDLILGPPLEPQPIELNFTGPGWMALYILLAVLFIVACILVWKHYKKNKYRRQAVKALKQLPIADYSGILHAMEILKSTAMRSFGREELAPLSGAELFHFLNQKYPAFNSNTTQAISSVFYQKSVVIGLDEKKAFIDQSQNWIRKHGV